MGKEKEKKKRKRRKFDRIWLLVIGEERSCKNSAFWHGVRDM